MNFGQIARELNLDEETVANPTFSTRITPKVICRTAMSGRGVQRQQILDRFSRGRREEAEQVVEGTIFQHQNDEVIDSRHFSLL